MCETASSSTTSTDRSREPAIVPLSEVVRFHGHLCPGVALGYLAAKIAIKELRPDPTMDDQLVAIVENAGCGLDAIRVVAGCTTGKRNLIIRDHGKKIYTFVNRLTNDAVRLSVRDRGVVEDPVFKSLVVRSMEGTASPEDIQELWSRMKRQVDAVPTEPPEAYFDIRRVMVDVPKKISRAGFARCRKCGEMVAEPHARALTGDLVCIPCLDEHTRDR